MATDSEQDPSWSIARVLRFATEDFKSRGIESARLEAEVLLGDIVALDRVGLLVQSERPLTPDELKHYRARIKRRRDGEPVAYILGEREFFGLSFSVDKRVLIPRPETELLVEEALERTSHRALSGRALDLCTGSGCVAVCFARERKTWQIFGTDVSADALAVARHNALRHGVAWNLSFHGGDLWDALPEGSRFELITSNPPYIPASDIPGLATEVGEFEPRLALDGGADGLSFYRRLTEKAPEYLVPGGVLAVEIGADQGSFVQTLFEENGFFDLRLLKDYAGHDRVISAKNGSAKGRRQASVS